MSDGRFQRETLSERLMKYERLRDMAQSDLSRYNAEIKAIRRRLARLERENASCNTCIEPKDDCAMRFTCLRDDSDPFRYWRPREPADG